MADRLVAVDDSTYLLPTPVRDAYLADVQNRITNAVSNLSGVAQAVADKVAPLTTDGQVAPVISGNTATRSAIYVLTHQAPPPTDGDDTSTIQPLLDNAAASNGRGELVLDAGQYKGNFTVSAGTNMPIIRARGTGYTSIKPLSASTPAMKLIGGPSGNIAGGGIRDLAFVPADSGGGTAIEFNNCDGVVVDNVNITSTSSSLLWDEGVRFRNTGTNLWTEFNTFEHGGIYFTKTPVRYMKDSGSDESFHGSGLIETKIGLPSTSTRAVQIDAGCFPYNAPMSVHLFNGVAGQALINNDNVNRSPTFYGDLSFELPNGPIVLGAGAGQEIYYRGTVEALSGGDSRNGKLWFIDRFNYDGTIKRPVLKPFNQQITASNVPVSFGPMPALDSADTFLITVSIYSTTGYRWTGVFYAFQQPGSPNGTVTAPTQLEYVNGNNAAWGAGVFSWLNGLYLNRPTNGSYPNDGTVTAYATFTPLGGGNSGHRFAQ